MPSIVNELLLKEYKQRYEKASTIISIGYEGLDIAGTNELRAKLAEREVRLDLIKNRIANIAFKEMGMPAIESICSGQTALAEAEDPVALARFFVDFRKEHAEVKIHGALVENTILDEAGVVALSKSPTKEELKGIIAGQAIAPGSNIAGALMGPARTIAGQVKALVEKKEEESA